ncbi:CBS domain-containing protein [uncultured Flavobacterium sp.]|uniref:CBS domain-containing protein n=1 Tax=uncultured Flavobacterium sp. TaxID=165435 RepID=UPI0030EC7CCF|tara:strand:+ start:73447 stop:74106 length:660 start_codon:yes stop_codon:yes gene_type:complete
MHNLIDYINFDIKPLKTTQTIADAQDLFLEISYSHFPVTENNIYIGCISNEDASSINENSKVGENKFNFERFFVRDSMIWLDVLEEFGKNDCNIMPVLNEKNKYIGYYELDDIIKFFQESPFLKEEGGIIVVQKPKSDYSIGQIAQIVEGNGGKLLGLFISNISENTVEVTLKISQSYMNEILQGFRRYEYVIISEHQEDSYLENLKERSDYLDKYLNI